MPITTERTAQENIMSEITNLTTITPINVRDGKICDVLGITTPGAYAIREPDGRLMVWASEADSIDDDGQLAIFRSAGPITDEEWAVVIQMSWIDDHEAM